MNETMRNSIFLILVLILLAGCGSIKERRLLKSLTDDEPVQRTYHELDISGVKLYQDIIDDALKRAGYSPDDAGRFFLLHVYNEQEDNICIISYNKEPIDWNKTLESENKQNRGYVTVGNHYFLLQMDKKHYRNIKPKTSKQTFNLYKHYFTMIHDPETICYIINDDGTFQYISYDDLFKKYYYYYLVPDDEQ